MTLAELDAGTTRVGQELLDAGSRPGQAYWVTELAHSHGLTTALGALRAGLVLTDEAGDVPSGRGSAPDVDVVITRTRSRTPAMDAGRTVLEHGQLLEHASHASALAPVLALPGDVLAVAEASGPSPRS